MTMHSMAVGELNSRRSGTGGEDEVGKTCWMARATRESIGGGDFDTPLSRECGRANAVGVFNWMQKQFRGRILSKRERPLHEGACCVSGVFLGVQNASRKRANRNRSTGARGGRGKKRKRQQKWQL